MSRWQKRESGSSGGNDPIRSFGQHKSSPALLPVIAQSSSSAVKLCIVIITAKEDIFVIHHHQYHNNYLIITSIVFIYCNLTVIIVSNCDSILPLKENIFFLLLTFSTCKMLILMKGKKGVLSEKQLVLQARKQLPSPTRALRAGESFFVYHLFSILSFHIHNMFFSKKKKRIYCRHASNLLPLHKSTSLEGWRKLSLNKLITVDIVRNR